MKYNRVMLFVVQFMENLHLGLDGPHARKNATQEFENDIDHAQIHSHHAKASHVEVAESIYKYAIHNHVVSKLIDFIYRKSN